MISVTILITSTRLEGEDEAQVRKSKFLDHLQAQVAASRSVLLLTWHQPPTLLRASPIVKKCRKTAAPYAVYPLSVNAAVLSGFQGGSSGCSKLWWIPDNGVPDWEQMSVQRVSSRANKKVGARSGRGAAGASGP